ncbi:MAG: glycoside hydrolase family 9 protein [Chitinophagaceae bacterium]|nr:glycoside hydrolase family 9 protein [Chitinophagaceae bacterium]
MVRLFIKRILPFAAAFFSLSAFAQYPKVLTNHVGYENAQYKQAVVISDKPATFTSFQLINDQTGETVFTGSPLERGRVDKWKNWLFWTMDFSEYTQPGTYRIQVTHNGAPISSFPFSIARNILEQSTLSDVIYYFKGQRSSGLLDEADHHLAFAGKTADTIDAHGGWYDATGDYGKHLSHLSFSTYFNPQQISITAWALLKSYQQLIKKPGTDFRQYNRRLLDEAMYGADYLARIQVPGGSFYRSVSAPGPGKLPKDRVIGKESKGYTIKKSKDQSFGGYTEEDNWKTYQASFRSGGGVSIAALAMAAMLDTTGSYSQGVYLKAAENAFSFLSKHNIEMTNDGVENIVDDYCALMAATELYKATQKIEYKVYAETKVLMLIHRLTEWGKYRDFWRADDTDRPFFHPSDAGLPVISLLEYYPLAAPAIQQMIKDAVKRSLSFELTVTGEVNNPFGYSRQLTQDTSGLRKTAFFFPHGSDAAPWWQGENARLGSMAAAARLSVPLFKGDREFADKLKRFAVNQLNWILGLNPFDACMLQGKGHNNPQYGFFGTFEYTNAPGGIVNGITSGFENEDDIDLNLQYVQTGIDSDWRWAEQWLPHAAWYMVAIAVDEK